MRIQIRSHVLVHSVDKIYVVVVKLKLIWSLFLNIFYFNFFPTPNQSLRFTRFRRSYVNCTAVVPTNDCQSYSAFLLDVNCSKWPRSFFFADVEPQPPAKLPGFGLTNTSATCHMPQADAEPTQELHHSNTLRHNM